MFLSLAFKRLNLSVMKAMPTEQSGLGLVGTPSDEILGKARDPMEMSSTLAQDVYEIHPRKGRDGFDRLAIASGGDQSVCRTRRSSQRGRVREVSLSFSLTLGDHPRVQ